MKRPFYFFIHFFSLLAWTLSSGHGQEQQETQKPPERGIAFLPLAEKKEFLQSSWNPFLEKLQKHLHQVEKRTERHFSLNERLLPQGELLQLMEENIRLKELWLGPGNGDANIVYKFMIDMFEKSQVTSYPYASLGESGQLSDDGHILILSGSLKNALSQKGDKEVDGNFVKSGGTLNGSVVEKIGPSPLEDLIPSTIMLPQERRQFMAARLAKTFLLKLLAKAHQKGILKLGPEIEGPLESWGQLPMAGRESFEQFLQQRLNGCPTLPSNSFWEKFVTFVRAHPGDYFHDETRPSDMDPKTYHNRVMITGFLLGKLAMGDREWLQNQGTRRYMGHDWERQTDLMDFDLKGSSFVRRGKGQKETSKITLNKYPYQKRHGLSLGSSGHSEGLPEISSFKYSLALPLNPDAHLENHHLIDLEKILTDAAFLNPKTDPAHLLPGEDSFFHVGQNTTAASSIHQTQHLQIGQGTFEDFPLLSNGIGAQKIATPALEKIPATMQAWHWGQDRDAVFFKFTTRTPHHPALIHFLNQLKMRLLEKYGKDHIDFSINVIPDGHGQFEIIFHPLANLQTETTPEGKKLTRNPLTGQTSLELSTAVTNISVAVSKGHLVVNDKDKDLTPKIIADGLGEFSKIIQLAKIPFLGQFLQEQSFISQGHDRVE